MIVHRMPQRSPEWYAVRVGKLTASQAKDMLATIKSGEAAARRDLRMQLVTERLTGRADHDGFVSDAMQRGIDMEAAALAMYEAVRGELVSTVGFLEHDTLAAGCSPDGLVGEGLLELKCPKSATHVKYLRTDALVRDYQAQLTHALWVSGAPWIDIASFDDRLPQPLAFVVTRLLAADVDLDAHEAKVRAFLAEVDNEVASLRGWDVLKETA